jgi:hypothetical protein
VHPTTDSRYRRAGHPALHAIAVARSPIHGDDSTVPGHNKTLPAELPTVFVYQTGPATKRRTCDRAILRSVAGPAPGAPWPGWTYRGTQPICRDKATRRYVNNSSLNGPRPRALVPAARLRAPAGCFTSVQEATCLGRIDDLRLSTDLSRMPDLSRSPPLGGDSIWRRLLPLETGSPDLQHQASE